MQNIAMIFGQSPFKHLVDHARKVHECVKLIRPIADTIIAQDMPKLRELQDAMSRTEYEADQIKDQIRQNLPRRFFLPVQREDLLAFVRQLDRMADDAEDFAVVSTFRTLSIQEPLRPIFLELVDKVVQVSESLLEVAEDLAELQRESFEGPDADRVQEKIAQVCHMEWETDKLSRKVARAYYSVPGIDPVVIILMEKLCAALTGIADHAENVGKNLRLMILRS